MVIVKRRTITAKYQIIQDIHELYADLRYDLDEALENMRTIEEAANDNANALADDIAVRDREGGGYV